MTTIIDYINVLDIFCLTLICLLILIKGPDTPIKWPSIIFILSVISYLIIDYLPDGVLFFILLSGPFLLPFTFWLVAKSLFSDKRISVKDLIYGVIILIIYYLLHFLESNSAIAPVLLRGISILFVVLAIVEAQKGRKSDLVQKRVKIRSIFTIVVSVIVLLTILAELGLDKQDQDLPKLLQRIGILLFNVFFIIANVQFGSSFFGKSQKKKIITNPELVDKIRTKVFQEGLYRTEELSIGLLSELIGEQEYIVRETINQQLGYRNFTDFINSFRIQESIEILSDPRQNEVTILEIAYKVGFNSIGPFNRAFKNTTASTPTAFRKQVLKLI